MQLSCMHLYTVELLAACDNSVTNYSAQAKFMRAVQKLEMANHTLCIVAFRMTSETFGLKSEHWTW